MNTLDGGVASVGLAWVPRPEATAADLIAGRNMVEEAAPAAGQPPAVDIRVDTPSPTLLPLAIGTPPPHGFPYLAIYVYWAALAAGALQVAANVATSP